MRRLAVALSLANGLTGLVSAQTPAAPARGQGRNTAPAPARGAATGKPLTIYVVDKAEYASRTRDIGVAYRERMGRHFPAMTLVEVRSLLEPGARVEIEATALL